jgi:hypothetical protein
VISIDEKTEQKIYRITVVMKVKTDIITTITV